MELKLYARKLVYECLAIIVVKLPFPLQFKKVEKGKMLLWKKSDVTIDYI